MLWMQRADREGGDPDGSSDVLPSSFGAMAPLLEEVSGDPVLLDDTGEPEGSG